MPALTLKPFQKEAVASGLALFTHAKQQLDALPPDDAEGRETVVAHHGHLLIEAPTGSGKTLMAGTLLEQFSQEDGVAWFWFAPFKGVVGQTEQGLRAQFAGLRVRDLTADRHAEGSRSGDVFVTTWQTVATRVTDSRNVRKTTEAAESVDALVERLRRAGLRIGVVVDEAHHGFHGQTLAFQFFRDVLRADYTVLVTATPDDREMKAYEKAMGLPQLNRIAISRQEAVDAGLIKEGIKCVAYFVTGQDERAERLVDFEGTALADGVRQHRRVQAELAAAKIDLVPLLLVQVDSRDRDVAWAKKRLLALGFAESEIATHTAKEPDKDLLALANDEGRQVLIFKMAVALGFDCPRAFTLVTIREAKDVDFGVQLVGRILRVHRRLQGRKVPDSLRYGYVFLGDAAIQSGLDSAAQRMNAIQTQYATISRTTTLVNLGGRLHAQTIGRDGQTHLLPIPTPEVASPEGEAEGLEATAAPITAMEKTPWDWVAEADDQGVFALEVVDAVDHGPLFAKKEPDRTLAAPSHRTKGGRYQYELRKGVPTEFYTETLPPPEALEVAEEECAREFSVTAEDIVSALAGSIRVQRKTVELFTQQMELELVKAKLSPEELAEEAEKLLVRQPQYFDPKSLREALVTQFQKVMDRMGFDEADDVEKVEQMLNHVLVHHRETLYTAQRKALRSHMVVQKAAPLPDFYSSHEPLRRSRANVYGVMPPDLNTWETEFATVLDLDATGTVLWWHRNPVRQPWSVEVMTLTGKSFFPDFVIGVQNRRRPDHALLADTKWQFETDSEVQKLIAEHAKYGRALIVTRNSAHRWTKVQYDENRRRAVFGGEFFVEDAVGF
ncbi:MAG: DEAD/DEAH box helicase family protein [Verrucomicrobiales bacterium]|nr:DEAD/DEAH box helicase family protein [Verrucomicrobiales bacterium]